MQEEMGMGREKTSELETANSQTWAVWEWGGAGPWRELRVGGAVPGALEME